MNTIETLDAISRCNNNCSDYKIAQLFGVSRQWISDLRNGRRTLSEQQRVTSAKLLNQDIEIQMIEGRIERSKDTEQKKAWKHALKKLTSTAAAVMLALGLTAPAENVAAKPFEPSNDIYYVKLLKAIIELFIIFSLYNTAEF